MEAPKNIAPCKLDILFTKSVPHILEAVFLSLDYGSFVTCLEVSTNWREPLTSESFLKKTKTVFQEEIDRGEEKLWVAAKEGNVNEVRFLSFLVDLNCVKGWNNTPLCVAAENAYTPSHKNVIQLLLQRGADPNKPDKDGWTPSYWAVYRGNRDVLKLLLERGPILIWQLKLDGLPFTGLHSIVIEMSCNSSLMEVQTLIRRMTMEKLHYRGLQHRTGTMWSNSSLMEGQTLIRQLNMDRLHYIGLQQKVTKMWSSFF